MIGAQSALGDLNSCVQTRLETGLIALEPQLLGLEVPAFLHMQDDRCSRVP